MADVVPRAKGTVWTAVGYGRRGRWTCRHCVLEHSLLQAVRSLTPFYFEYWYTIGRIDAIEAPRVRKNHPKSQKKRELPTHFDLMGTEGCELAKTGAGSDFREEKKPI